MRFFRYWNDDPWADAPPWAIELRKMLARVIRLEGYEMTQQQDIKDAMDVMTKDIAAQTTVVQGMSVFIAGIQKQLVDLANASKDDETAKGLMALAAQAESNTKALSDAMASNLTGVTPAQAGTTEPAPAPVEPAPVSNVPQPDPPGAPSPFEPAPPANPQ